MLTKKKLDTCNIYKLINLYIFYITDIKLKFFEMLNKNLTIGKYYCSLHNCG